MLQRQVYVAGRVKTMNNAIMENVDAIHNAIARNLKISFQYFQWNVKKEPELRKNGARYVISPWGLSWDDENYYMVGYDAGADMNAIKDINIGTIEDTRSDKLGKIASKLKKDLMLFLRNCDGLNVSDKSFKVLKHDNNRITLEEEL